MKMSSHRGVSTIAIVLLIMGLTVGAGGGYYVVFSNLQPKIVEYEAQVTQLNSEVSGLIVTVSSLQAEKSVLEESTLYEEANETNQKLAEINSELTSTNSELRATLSEIVDKYEELNESYGALEEAFNALQEEYVTLSGEAETVEPNRFARYGFSFEYPEGWTLSLSSLLGTLADEGTGIVAVTSEDETSTYMISWMGRAVIQPILENMNMTFAEYIETAGLDYAFTILSVVELGERVTSTKDGNTLTYQTGTMEGGKITREYQDIDETREVIINFLEGGEFIITGWYSEESINDYVFSVIMLFSSGYEPTDIESTMLQFLENFKCY